MTVQQLDLVPFHGATYDPERDMERLTAQQLEARRAMLALGWCDADMVTRWMERRSGKRIKTSAIDRQMRYIREWADADPGWRWEKRDAGGGALEHRLVRIA